LQKTKVVKASILCENIIIESYQHSWLKKKNKKELSTATSMCETDGDEEILANPQICEKPS
jgi:hypothetical protein